MKSKKELRFLKIQVFLVIIGVAAIVVGSSYAIFSNLEQSNKKQVIQSGSLQFSLTNETGNIIISQSEEKSDVEGMANSLSYSFNVTNTGSLVGKYKVLLIDDTSITNTDPLDITYVRGNIKVNGKHQSPAGLTTNSRVIGEKVLNPGKKDSVEVRVWINYGSLSQTEKAALNGKSVYLKVKIEAEQYFGESLADESGANEPLLANGMIPVFYDEEKNTWKKASSNYEYCKLGDADGDGVITIKDLSSIIDASKGKTLSGCLKNAADVNKDGNITQDDATLLQTAIDNETDLGYVLGYDSSNENIYSWYNYDNKKWANAVTVAEENRGLYYLAEPGTEISMDDINTMFVWIPRFSVSGNFTTYNGTNDINNPGSFDITFLTGTEGTSHDAFTFESSNPISGFWAGKFENSATTIPTSTNNTPQTIIIKPNVQSFRYANVSTFFTSSRNMQDDNNIYGFDSSLDKTLDTHMIKNSEWGAISYLTQSVYGRCTSTTNCVEVTKNNCDTYVTGIGGETIDSSNNSTSCTSQDNMYSGKYGILASTTGNIYGIYDMHGGSSDYVMGNYNSYSGSSTTNNSGFSGTNGPSSNGVTWPDTKYINVYTSESSTSSLNHGLIETKTWFKDSASFVSSTNPWMVRGENGIFSYTSSAGTASSNTSSRVTIIK